MKKSPSALWHNLESHSVRQKLEVDSQRGLSAGEVMRRQAVFGLKVFPQTSASTDFSVTSSTSATLIGDW